MYLMPERTYLLKFVLYICIVSLIFGLRLQILTSVVSAEEIESTNFIIKGDSVSAGSGTGNSSNFGITADINPFSDLSTSANFRQETGYNPRIQANTPYPPTLENSESYYDKLLLKVDDSGNPADTLFAVIISDNNFSTFKYVQNDGTVGDTLEMEDYLTYDSWGGVDGSYILNLKQNTTYKARIKALNGDFTETGYSSDSNESTTTVPYVNMTVSESSITLGTLNINLISQTTSVSIRVNTNAYTGYQAYVSDQGNGVTGGLYNGGSGLITSADMTLTAGVAGYGAQANSATANVDSKYAVVGNQVGALELSSNPLSSNNVAALDEDTTIWFKATMSPTTLAGNYADIVYFTITPNL